MKLEVLLLLQMTYLLFGQIDIQIKLITNYSARTILDFIYHPDQPNRDEMDFVIPRNVSGQLYLSSKTNVYADGVDDRREKIFLWFDPTEDFCILQSCGTYLPDHVNPFPTIQQFVFQCQPMERRQLGDAWRARQGGLVEGAIDSLIEEPQD
ncbi:Glycoside hydrolase family 16 [Dillenia turbinata]|uniref:Glycoside hydrolase family 16 n=1 Tax=Dillenia turbinata TaxID=194707 RepID=A0AAN8YXW5_9MAGN